MANSPQQEALELFASVLRDLSSSGADLELVFRRCQFACELAGWQPARDWFQRERAGYAAGQPVPDYRRAVGIKSWIMPEAGMVAAIATVIAERQYGRQTKPGPDEPTTIEVRGSLTTIQELARTGAYRDLDESRRTRSRELGREIVWRRRERFEASAYATTLSELERLTYDFASSAYRTLRYGNTITDIWSEYRSHVDTVVQARGFTSHLEAIESGMRSANPEEWRNAIYGCRNLLDDLSRYLWQDARRTYDLIRRDNRAIEVDRARSDRFANRLAAYAHQKALRDNNRKFVERQLEYIDQPVRALTAWQGEAHAGFSRDDARSVALATYFIIGELATKTDMQPILEWAPSEVTGAPAAADAGGAS